MSSSLHHSEAFPNEVKASKDDCDRFNRSFTIEDIEKMCQKTDDPRDESTSIASFSDKDLSKKSVCFECMATMKTVRNLRTDLTPQERSSVWYSGKEINEFSTNYARELHLDRFRKEQLQMTANQGKKKKTPAKKVKKFFSARRKSLVGK